jgi:hypothetical protein
MSTFYLYLHTYIYIHTYINMSGEVFTDVFVLPFATGNVFNKDLGIP